MLKLSLKSTSLSHFILCITFSMKIVCYSYWNFKKVFNTTYHYWNLANNFIEPSKS